MAPASLPAGATATTARAPSTMTTERPDLYAILGVAPSATQAEISHAYRAMLRRHHPDTRDPADEAQSAMSDAALQQVLAAYTVLGDPTRRADYDRQAKPDWRPTRPLRQTLRQSPETVETSVRRILVC